MILNPIEDTLEAIRSADRSKKAAMLRLQKAGVLTKSGKPSSLYRRSIVTQNSKG